MSEVASGSMEFLTAMYEIDGPERQARPTADACRKSWEEIQPIMPSVGGGVGRERMAALRSALGQDVIVVVGSWVQQDSEGVVAALTGFHRVLSPDVM